MRAAQAGRRALRSILQSSGEHVVAYGAVSCALMPSHWVRRADATDALALPSQVMQLVPGPHRSRKLLQLWSGERWQVLGSRHFSMCQLPMSEGATTQLSIPSASCAGGIKHPATTQASIQPGVLQLRSSR